VLEQLTVWSIIEGSLSTELKWQRRHAIKPVKKLNVRSLCQRAIQQSFHDQLDKELSKIPEAASAAAEWSHMWKATHQATVETLGYRKCINRDWFDENDTVAWVPCWMIYTTIISPGSRTRVLMLRNNSTRNADNKFKLSFARWRTRGGKSSTGSANCCWHTWHEDWRASTTISTKPQDVHSAPIRSKELLYSSINNPHTAAMGWATHTHTHTLPVT